MTLFIGDVHGHFGPYHRIVHDHPNSIQVGDMGVGFYSRATGRKYGNPTYDKMKEGGHRFIRGNHDNPEHCRKHPQCIPDGHVEGDVMFVGGGLSIDRVYRTEGYDFWSDEELSPSKLAEIIEDYKVLKPRVMVTHDCPNFVAQHMIHYKQKLDFPSITRDAFDAMASAHMPELWIFGHWHKHFDQVLEGCRFVCLDELEAREFDVGLS
jgi:hypothetical protein